MTRSPRTRIAAAAFGTALLVAGCGSGDDTSIDDLSVDETAAAEAIESADSVLDDVAAEVDETSADLAQALRDNGLDSVALLVEQVDITSLTGGAEFTFLAPNNEAFTAISADETADLLTDPTSIVDVLRNHVVQGEVVMADGLAGMDEFSSLGGESFPVTVDGEIVMVGDATIVQADIEAGDGVVHIVDRVLLP
jgi:uncharacterized surface protein with fasciclin (FAS1) repeats